MITTRELKKTRAYQFMLHCDRVADVSLRSKRQDAHLVYQKAAFVNVCLKHNSTDPKGVLAACIGRSHCSISHYMKIHKALYGVSYDAYSDMYNHFYSTFEALANDTYNRVDSIEQRCLRAVLSREVELSVTKQDIIIKRFTKALDNERI